MEALHGFRRATESEVVLAFLRGELDSDRFGDEIKLALDNCGGLELVRSPDLESEAENQARAQALSIARGWPNTELFDGFPAKVEWFHGVLGPEVLERVRFIDYLVLERTLRSSRRPADVLPTPTNRRAASVADATRNELVLRICGSTRRR